MTFLFSAKKDFLVWAACLAMVPLFSFSGSMPPDKGSKVIVQEAGDEMTTDILNHVNQYRQSKGLPPLQLNTVISAEAKKHSANMALRKTAFGHDGFENRVRLIIQQLGPMRRSAENVAYGHLTAKQVVEGWIKSPGHRKNIEGGYTITGIGTATAGDGTIFFTQIFTAK